MKIPNKKERQKIAFNHSSGINFKNSFLVIDTTLAPDNSLSYRKNLLKI